LFFIQLHITYRADEHGLPAHRQALSVSRHYMRFLCFLIILSCIGGCIPGQNTSERAERSDSLNIRARFFLEKGKLDSAKVLIAQALELNPNNYAAYNNRAYLKWKEKRPSIEVVKDYELSLNLSPNYQVALYSLANYYFEVKDYRNALNTANDYIERSKTNDFDPSFMDQVVRIKEKSEWKIFGYNRVVDGTTLGQAIAFFDSMNRAIDQARPTQQTFIDKLTFSIIELSEKGRTSIDIKQLKIDLDSAILAGEQELARIEKVNEIDKKINYRQNVLDYILLRNSIYKNEFRESLGFLEKAEAKGFKMRSEEILNRLLQLKNLELEFKQSQRNFKNKYGFTTPEK
jgi:tetratricopeptide (TPR) repeat protein